MKNTVIFMAVSAALSMASLNASAATQDGTITINGKVVADTCLVSINGSTAQPTGTQAPLAGAGTAANTVTLKTVPASLFPASGTVVESAPVKISYTACTGITTVQPNFSASSNLVAGVGHLANIAATTPATNVDLQLSESAGGPALDLTDANALTPVAVVSNKADVDLYASYISTAAAVTPGNVNTVATFTTNYQ